MKGQKTKTIMVAVCVTALLAVSLLAACSTAPYTGRTRLMLTTEDQENEMGAQYYKEFMRKARPSANASYNSLVSRVGQRLAAVTGKSNYAWEFKVVESNEINAWCLPGGKIVFYTGIMKIFENEAEIAVVMGHEMAHALLRHGGERMSQEMVVGTLGAAIAAMTEGDQNRELYMAAFGGISSVGVILPFSRKHEYEADYTGTMLTAKAGYDPGAAAAFWRKMMKMGSGKVPEFLSTHPSDDKRVRALEKVSAKMRSYYGKAPVQYGLGDRL